MPEHGQAYATFAEEPSGGSGDDKTPWRGPFHDHSAALETYWRNFGRAATAVAVVSAPVFFLLFTRAWGWSNGAAAILTVLAAIAFRGLAEIVARRFIPSPSLWGDDGSRRARDITDRRRASFWRFWYRIAVWALVIYALAVLATLIVQTLRDRLDLRDAFAWPLATIRDQFGTSEAAGGLLSLAVTVPLIFAVNVLIFLGPLVYSGLRQMSVFEPGDFNWGARMEDVRGQAMAKDAVAKIVTLWQSGEAFEAAGGKRERGVLFLGPAGTGKTMLAKSIAAKFNCPFVSAPATAFTQAFIGVDVVLVMWMGWRARRLSRKWGGQCIVFIDEIDAIGMRRAALLSSPGPTTIHDLEFHGPMGAVTSSGDLIVESAAWRQRLFDARGERLREAPGGLHRMAEGIRRFVFPGTGGIGQGGLQQLLIQMDGVQSPPMVRKYVVNRINTLLDASFVIPERVGNVPLRLRPVRARKEDVFYIGACNVPLAALDPALIRPGRLGRSVLFRTPDRKSREDIIDLYLGKIAHDPELDSDDRREELARITMGHSPAMIEQVCSLALSRAHFDGRHAAQWADLVDSITVVEAGLDNDITVQPDEVYATAIHEAGHAVTGHMFMEHHESTRLSIRSRGGSLGHHSMREVEERHSAFAREVFADLVWTFGAMASELVFFGDTTKGVGGDLDSASSRAALMVGTWGMTARPIDLRGRFADGAPTEIALRKLRRRYRRLGESLMNRSSSPELLEDDTKRAEAATILGQAFMTAYWFVRHNRDAVAQVADVLVERQELFGDEVVELLAGANLTIPEIDPLDETNWPTL